MFRRILAFLAPSVFPLEADKERPAKTAGQASNENVGYVVGTTLLLTVAGFVGAYVFACYSCTTGHQVSTALVLIVAGAAALILGTFIGFLFGIPRYAAQAAGPLVKQVAPAATGDQAAKPEFVQVANPTYSNNTNLEQVSDWLTKTLLGVALTQLSDIRHYVLRAAQLIFPSTDCTPNGPAFAAGLLVFFFGSGFFFGYLMTALKLGQALNDAQESQKDKQRIVQLGQELGEKKDELGQKERDLRQVADNIRNNGNVGGTKNEKLAELVANNAHDPHKGQWGGTNQVGGYLLTATVRDLTPDIGEIPAIYDVTFFVTDQQKRPSFEGSEVTFHLHPSFVPDTVRVLAKNGTAVYATRAWGGFTVGAEVALDGTKLELDLAGPNVVAAEQFKQR